LSRARDEEKRGRLEREIKRVSGLQAQTDAELDEINCLGAQVEQGIAALTAVGVSDFLKAVKGSEEARQKVSSHFLGLFPPWDDPPDWFDKASKFGG